MTWEWSNIAALCIATSLLLFQSLQPAHADFLDTAQEAASGGESYMHIALTPIFQYATRAGEDTGNFEVDLIGAQTIIERPANQHIGSASLIYWVFSVNNFGDMQSTADFAEKAGLLWPTNDVVVSDSYTAFGVFAWQQNLLQDRLVLDIGKLFVGNFVLESPYTASNTETFMSRMISNDMAGRYFDTIGLGAQLLYKGDNWFLSGGFADATAGDEFDFDTFYNGDWTVYGEAGYRPERSLPGISVISLLTPSADATTTLNNQQSISMAFTHEFGQGGADYAVFGRYTFADGGSGKMTDSLEAALPLDNGGFLGFAWNKPFGHDAQQIGAALMYGEPTAYREAQGFSDQYGIETYWKFDILEWLRITGDLQVVNNIDDKIEIVPGFRLKLHKTF
jgi:hypothetical protein